MCWRKKGRGLEELVADKLSQAGQIGEGHDLMRTSAILETGESLG